MNAKDRLERAKKQLAQERATFKALRTRRTKTTKPGPDRIIRTFAGDKKLQKLTEEMRAKGYKVEQILPGSPWSMGKEVVFVRADADSGR